MNEVVAVTGAEGFIGSHLVETLVARGNRVRAMVQYNSFSSWGWLETIPADVMADVEVVLGDVRDPGSVLDLMRGVDVVYHLAALIAIPYSYRAPSSYLATNGGGTLNVLEAARQLDTGRIVHTSTSEVYGTARVAPIPETHPLQAQSPYSASKIAGDKMAESYHLSFETPVVTLRPFNTFGPRQSARAVISTIISQVAAGKTEILLGLAGSDPGLHLRHRHRQCLRHARQRAGRRRHRPHVQLRLQPGDLDQGPGADHRRGDGSRRVGGP